MHAPPHPDDDFDGVRGAVFGPEHPILIVFDRWHPGTRWADWFRGDELVVVEDLSR